LRWDEASRAGGRRPARLLIVDAPSGPLPDVYLPLLPAELDLRLIALQMGDAELARRRLETLLASGRPVQVVTERVALPQAIEEVAASWGPDGIFALSERVVHEAAAVAHALGLPANTPASQQALRDKALQRRRLQDGGVAVPAWHRIASRDDLRPAAAAVGFPAILKPTVGSASLSVFAVDSWAELAACYTQAVAVYERDPRQCAAPIFILEARLCGQCWHPDPRLGDYVSVESLVSGSQVVHFMLTDKFTLMPPFRERGQILPSTLPESVAAALVAEADRACAALGVEAGALHTEIKMTAAGPRIIEVNGRIGGGIVEQMQLATGYNVVAEIAASALGLPIVPPPPRAEPTYAAYYLASLPAFRCRVTAAPAVETLLALPGVTFAQVLLPAGAEPDWRRGNYECTSRAFAVSPCHEDLMSLSELLLSNRLFSFERLDDDAEPAAGVPAGPALDATTPESPRRTGTC
jgi:biotin carboxylase